MPSINLCFLWHMHQPFYKNLVTGQYRLPWVRLHALKDYYGMVKILDEFPNVHQTFNLVPSLLVQIEEYAAGTALDPFLELALKPAEELEQAEKEFILRYFFQANEERLIGRYPRYEELFGIMRQNEYNPSLAAPKFDNQMLRDLQVLSQIAWFDEEDLARDSQVRELARKARNYQLEDQQIVGRKQVQMYSRVIAAYRACAARRQIELSASAYYHPILPLLCDSNIATESHPYVPLPSTFAYPADAEEQLKLARNYFESKFGKPPDGLWPSEGSVSDQTLQIASRLGFKWTASDDGVLGKTLAMDATPELTYRPYLWKRGADQIRVLFRDHRLSDLIGFVYSSLDPEEAAEHFLGEVRKNCDPILRAGRDALVPIFLDGENAWECYRENGRPFLRELYARITADPRLASLTITEALERTSPTQLQHIFPGSWINSNFDIWIGSEEDNSAWEELLRARKMYDETSQSPQWASIPEENKRLAWNEILIAEGSDWCWWYGPEHSSANRGEFDQLYRDHLSNVYRLLGRDVPPGLGRPILKPHEVSLHQNPTGFIQPVIDGVLSSRAEWAGAGRYRMERRSAGMHSQRNPIHELMYGTDGQNLYLRLDLTEPFVRASALEIRLRLRNSGEEEFKLHISGTDPDSPIAASDLPAPAVAAALGDFCEVRISLNALHVRLGESLYVRVSVFREGLPISCLPLHGELELQSNIMAEYA